MLEDIKQRLAVLPDYKDMNPYTLFFDAKYLLSELEFYIRINKELERQVSEAQDHD